MFCSKDRILLRTLTIETLAHQSFSIIVSIFLWTYLREEQRFGELGLTLITKRYFFPDRCYRNLLWHDELTYQRKHDLEKTHWDFSFDVYVFPDRVFVDTSINHVTAEMFCIKLEFCAVQTVAQFYLKLLHVSHARLVPTCQHHQLHVSLL
jgi:hypothetical protein